MLSVPQHLPARQYLGYLHAPILHSQSCSMSQGRVHSGQSTVPCRATATDVVSTDCVVIGSGMGGERGFRVCGMCTLRTACACCRQDLDGVR